MGPTVTIVTPTLNQRRYLPEAVKSVLAQDYPHIEYLVMDGGSIDGSVGYLGSIRDDRLRWRSGPDGGQAAALIEGFRWGTGDVLAWLNADDAYAPGAVRRAVEVLENDASLGLVYGRAEFVDAEGRRLGPCAHVGPFDAHRLLHEVDLVAQPAAFFTRAAFLGAGGIDSALEYCFDYDLWLRLARHKGVRFIDEVLACVRVHGGSKTARGGLARLVEIERMVARHGRARLPQAFSGEMLTACRRELGPSLRSRHWHEAGQCLRGTLVYGWACALQRLRRTIA